MKKLLLAAALGIAASPALATVYQLSPPATTPVTSANAQFLFSSALGGYGTTYVYLDQPATRVSFDWNSYPGQYPVIFRVTVARADITITPSGCPSFANCPPFDWTGQYGPFQEAWSYEAPMHPEDRGFTYGGHYDLYAPEGLNFITWTEQRGGVTNLRADFVSAVPEPSTYALLAAGLGIVTLLGVRRAAVRE